MRLRTKIIFICCISVLVSSIVCSVAVYSFVKRSSREAAEAQGFQNAVAAFLELEKKGEELQIDKEDAVSQNVVEYLLKQQQSDMLLCFSVAEENEEEIVNSTVFQKKDLEALSYHVTPDSLMETASLQWEGSHLLVYRKSEFSRYEIYWLEDITYVWERMDVLRMGLIFLTVVITAVVSLVVFFILNRVLSPLHKLSIGAKQIARGDYEGRIAVKRRDEIGELSDDFNQMAEAVQSRTKSMEEEQQKKTLFMANLTHEWKTPMTAISGYAKTLLTVKLSEEDREEALSYINDESCRLERLSQKMMSLLLLEENNKTELVETSAAELFHKAEEACRRSLQKDGIGLECHENGETFFVDCDLFTEVLINLIDNARKASRRGDKIILSASQHTIEVRDFGTGIPEDEKEKILEPFYMIDKSRSRKNGGAGLGLAITALIVKQHNASIQIESKVGEGTRMILQFV